MNVTEIARQLIATYERHGWTLRRVLLCGTTRSKIVQQIDEVFNDAQLIDSDIDALWFARPSQRGREAWELRHLSEQPYALFEAFEADETEEDREDARQEMEARMREHLSK